MQVDDIELIDPSGQPFQHQDMRRHAVAYGSEAECLRADRIQLRLRLAIATGEQSHVMAEHRKLVAQISDNPLRPSVEFRRDRLGKRRYLRNPHSQYSFFGNHHTYARAAGVRRFRSAVTRRQNNPYENPTFLNL